MPRFVRAVTRSPRAAGSEERLYVLTRWIAEAILPQWPTPAPGLADGGRRPAIHRAKCGVEPSDAREPRSEGDRGHGERGPVDQCLRALHPPGRRDGGRRGARVSLEQPA